MKKILVILTGGTICSAPDTKSNNKNQSNAEFSKGYIIDGFYKSKSEFRDQVEFDTIKLNPDILSENATIGFWNNLLLELKKEEIYTKYVGIIILHGTDTLAFTSSMLSMVMAGAPIPIMLVSSHLPLTKKETINGKEYIVENKKTNGYINFNASVELMLNGIEPNVYVVYKNPKGKLYVHFGSQLLQCKNYSNLFESEGKILSVNNNVKGERFETDSFYLRKINKIDGGVLLISPYVGLDYSKFKLKGVRAVVHGTYHSDTVCVERKSKQEKFGKNSILWLIKRCKKKGIPLILAPCDKDAYAYASTGDALEFGAIALSKTTLELAYAKTVLGVSLNLKGKDLVDFLQKSINKEFIYK